MKSKNKSSTIKDVAKEAGVSVGTVSRVVNNHYAVSKKAKAAVALAMQKLDYQPNAIAQSMRTRTSKAVGFVVTDISNPLFAEIAHATEERLNRDGFSMMLANTNGNTAREIQSIQVLKNRNIDAMVISINEEGDPALLEALEAVNCPVVILDRELPLPFDSVMSDHRNGTKLATNYLLSLGHKDIALMAPGEQISPGRERLMGFQLAMKESNTPIDPSNVACESLSSEFGYQKAFSLLSAKRRPTAIIAGGNQIFEGVLAAIRQIGLRIPEDISLLCCDDTALARLSAPPISVIDRDLAIVGQTLGEVLLRRLGGAGGDTPQRIVLPTELKIRMSCGRPYRA